MAASQELPQSLPKILVVEDDTVLVEIISHMLSPFSSNVAHTDHVKTALKLLSDDPYSLVISDYHLGSSKLTGLDLWAKCQQLYPKLPFILISGVQKELFSDMIRKNRSCPQFYLNKPFSQSEAQKLVGSILPANPAARLNAS